MLFDSDGVLVEPPGRERQAAATRAAFRECGVEDPDAAHVDAIVDGVTVERLNDICDTYDLDPASFWTAREHHDEQSQFAAFRAGDRDVYPDVEVIEGIGRARGVVSNNHHSTIAFVLDHFDLHAAFDTHYGREKTVESLSLKKPDTHYLERALDDLGTDDALYVGDSESDVVAARRAGLDSAFVRRPHVRDVALDADPTHEVEDLHGVSDIVGE